jgi:hypothetical protein
VHPSIAEYIRVLKAGVLVSAHKLMDIMRWRSLFSSEDVHSLSMLMYAVCVSAEELCLRFGQKGLCVQRYHRNNKLVLVDDI